MIHGDLEGLHARFEEQRTLNNRLENDLLRVNHSTDSGRASGTATPSQDPLAGMNLGRKVCWFLALFEQQLMRWRAGNQHCSCCPDEQLGGNFDPAYHHFATRSISSTKC